MSYVIYFGDNLTSEPIWSFQVDDIEILAGMMAVAPHIISIINKQISDAENIQVQHEKTELTHEIVLDTRLLSLENAKERHSADLEFTPFIDHRFKVDKHKKKIDKHEKISISTPDDLALYRRNGNSILKHRYWINSNPDVSHFCIKRGADYESVFRNDKLLSSHHIGNSHFRIWINSMSPQTYDLYHFSGSAFIQGLLSICNAFHVDFRDYIFTLPFDDKYTPYRINGYNLDGDIIGPSVKDLTDVDEEAADNDNLIEPLRKEY